jgi:sugar O-acyltransferase (sialic acid O-acetyltransferase NeuD family)
MKKTNLVIFGASNILSDIFECALACNLTPGKIVLDLQEPLGERDIPLQHRINNLSKFCMPPEIIDFEDFTMGADEVFILGPTTPLRENLANKVFDKFKLSFFTLIHPSAYISPMAKLGQGIFVGAGSIIGPGACIENNVFINRGVTIGHDTKIGSYSRIQPGCNIGGLTQIGKSTSIGIGATIVERINVGENTVIGAGSIVLNDLESNVLVAGVPAVVKKHL